MEALKPTIEMVGVRDDMTKDENLTISQMIGPFDAMVKTAKYDTLSDAIMELQSTINGTNISVNNNALVVKGAINKLCDVLNENGIEIDSNSLWGV
jgi:hypothetical protein